MRNNNTKIVSFCGIISALSIFLIFLGTLIDILDLTSVAASSFLAYIVINTYGYKWGFALFSTVSLVTLCFFPGKFAPLIYILFGFYPFIKKLIEKLFKSEAIRWIIKLILFNLIFSVFLFFAKELLFTEDILENSAFIWYSLAFAFVNIYVVLFDIVCSRLIIKYKSLFLRFFD